LPGTPGPAGPPGPAGEIDQDWTLIAKVNWPHAAVVSADDALNLLQLLNIRLSRSLSPSVQQEQPQVVQVWFEPAPINAASNRPGAPLAVLTVVGDATFTPQTIKWASRHGPDDLKKTLSMSGRVLIRIHCGALLDEKRRQLSGSLEAIIPANTIRLPGGVFESWFHVK
jgi:hypothetical protein